MPVQIKICGIKRTVDALAALRAGVDAIGLNFSRESPRYVGDCLAARQIVDETKDREKVQWAGVFVNSALSEVLEIQAALGLNIVQLHGDERPEFVSALAKRLGPGVMIWKAFRVSVAADLNSIYDFNTCCDAWLIDAKAPGLRGGSGKVFDWKILANLKRERPVVLAGGLNAGNVAAAVHRVSPEWVDTASGVESAPGVKDAAMIESFVRAARSAKETES